MDTINLEQYLIENIEKGVIDFSIRASLKEDGRVVFYIHPSDQDGETLDFELQGNNLQPNRDITKIQEPKELVKEEMQVDIPNNLEECFTSLDEITREYTQWLRDVDENEVLVKMHHSLGRWMRNNWGLWDEKSKLHLYFKNNFGLWHADDMSSVIIASYCRYLNFKPLKLEELAKKYLDYWSRNKNGD